MIGLSTFALDDEMDENVFLNDSRTAEESRDQLKTDRRVIPFLFVAVFLGLYGIVYAIDNDVPIPLLLSKEYFRPDDFIAERVRNDLKAMTDLGPRIAGDATNEVRTVDLLKREIAVIVKNARPIHELEVDVQLVSGSHYLNRTPHGSIMAYSNLQNVVVKLHGDGNASLLVNAHFDSVPTSPGASDDAVNCAVMLEILRKISREFQRPLNSIVFLFNGAEEPGLLASHGFITEHKWAKECKVVLNLEAAGSGGKIILFQTGPAAPWLMKYYKEVPHPYGQAAGEEIFQSNLVPSDTDFRIFRDYGGLIGLDMAFFKNGYRYHTKHDDLDHIPLGSIQNVGNNALSLVRSLAGAPEVADPKENPGKVVFFDVLGFGMVSYSETTAQIINYITVLLSLAVFAFDLYTSRLGRHSVCYFALTFGAIIGGWILSAIFVVLLALFLDTTGFAMSWYANTWLVLGLYVTPTVVISSVLLPLVNRKSPDDATKTLIQAHCVRTIWTVPLFVGTVLNIRATYVFLIPVLFNTLAFLFIWLFRKTCTTSRTPTETDVARQNVGKAVHCKKWQIVYVILLIIPTIFLMYAQVTIFSLFIPLTGRIGPDKNADLRIGVAALFFTILITSPFIALVTTFKNIKFCLIFLAIVFAITFLVIFTPLGFPYSGNKDSPAPQRYWIIHTSRIFNDENGNRTQDSGYFLLNMDRNSPREVKDYVEEIAKGKFLDEDCHNYLMCGVPIVHSKMIEIIKYSTWIPVESPQILNPPTVNLSKTNLSPVVLRYNLSISGPDRMAVYISPKKNVKLVNISLLNRVTERERTAVWNERDLYYIFHVYGKRAAPLTFTFDVDVSKNSEKFTTEIAVCGIDVHDDTKKDANYVKFLKQFPDWTDVTAWVGSYSSWWI